MSQKVQHIPPSGHLSTASLALLMAGQSLTTQYLSGVDIRGLVLADIAASLLLVLVCGTRFLRIVSLLQGLLSLFCLSYAASMGMPPTLAAILNGSRQIAGMDLRSLWTYIDPAALVALSLLVAIQCWLCGRKPRYRHRWLAIIPACALLATQYNACLLQPPRHFTPEFILGEGRSRFEPPARRSLKYRGYLGTFLMELGSGTAFTPRMSLPEPAPPLGLIRFPFPPPRHSWHWCRWSLWTLSCWKWTLTDGPLCPSCAACSLMPSCCAWTGPRNWPPPIPISNSSTVWKPALTSSTTNTKMPIRAASSPSWVPAGVLWKFFMVCPPTT